MFSSKSVKFLGQCALVFLHRSNDGLQLLVSFLESLNFKSLAFSGRLGSAAVSENTLYPTLLLLIVCLGSFPECEGEQVCHVDFPSLGKAYLGGRFVLGSGRT